MIKNIHRTRWKLITLIYFIASLITTTYVMSTNLIAEECDTLTLEIEPIVESLPGFYSFIITSNSSELFSYTLNYGDGSSGVYEIASSILPTHFYESNGTYVPFVTTTTSEGCDLSNEAEITVTTADECSVVISSNPQTNPGHYTFAYESHRTANIVTWDFRDGTTIVDTNPINSTEHTYTQNGSYTALVIVEDITGCIALDSIPIEISNITDSPDCDAMQVSIYSEYMDDDWNGSLAYSFGLESAYNFSSFTWDFGDGSLESETITPIHEYNSKGDYNVIFSGIATNGCSLTDTINLTVTDIIDSPDCDAMQVWISSSEWDESGKYSFTVETSDPFTSFNWDFGDSTSESGSINPVHEYTDNGEYIVTFSATSLQECPMIGTDTIFVNGIDEGFQISGEVLTNKSTVATGIVILYQKNQGHWSAVNSGLIQSGNYTIKNVEAGDYLLFALPEETHYSNFLPTYFVNAFDWGRAFNLTLDQSTFGVNITLIAIEQDMPQGNGNISGNILVDSELYNEDIYNEVGTNSAGGLSETGAVNLPVYLKNNSGSVVAWTLTNATGDYEFTNLPSGDFHVSLEMPSTSGGESATISLSEANNSIKLASMEVKRIDLVTSSPNEIPDVTIVYPNPSPQGSFTFSQPISGTIYNQVGQAIQTFINEKHISLEGSNRGIYLLKPLTGRPMKLIIR